MQIIKQLIDQLTDGKTTLTDIFMNAKVIAFKLKNNELSQWIDREVNGYPNAADVPEYRIFSGQIIGSITNGVYFHKNTPIPLSKEIFGDDLIKTMTEIKMCESIATMEQMVSGGNDDNTLSYVIQSDLFYYFNRGLDNGYQVQSAYRQFSKFSVTQALASIKSKMIDFLLRLDEEIGDDADVKKLAEGEGKQKLEAMFKGSVFGPNTTFILGNNNQQTVTNHNIQKGSFKELEKFLLQNNVDKKDIEELKVIIDSDNPLPAKQQYGDKVQGWISKMIGKSMSSTWDISVGAAATLLAQGISQYYGWMV